MERERERERGREGEREKERGISYCEILNICSIRVVIQPSLTYALKCKSSYLAVQLSLRVRVQDGGGHH